MQNGTETYVFLKDNGDRQNSSSNLTLIKR
jgi:hypothetical protein